MLQILVTMVWGMKREGSALKLGKNRKCSAVGTVCKEIVHSVAEEALHEEYDEAVFRCFELPRSMLPTG